MTLCSHTPQTITLHALNQDADVEIAGTSKYLDHIIPFDCNGIFTGWWHGQCISKSWSLVLKIQAQLPIICCGCVSFRPAYYISTCAGTGSITYDKHLLHCEQGTELILFRVFPTMISITVLYVYFSWDTRNALFSSSACTKHEHSVITAAPSIHVHPMHFNVSGIKISFICFFVS